MNVEKGFFLFDIFRKGSSVFNEAAAKNKAGLAVALGVLLATLPRFCKMFFGVEIELTQEDANQIALAIVTIAGGFGIFATSDKVGLLPAKHTEQTESTSVVGTNPPQDTSASNGDTINLQDLRGGP